MEAWFVDLFEPVLVVEGCEDAGTKPSLTVEVFFDFVCPWCLIGKRQLDAAARRLAELRPDVRLRIVWRSHCLLPDTPADGVPYQAFYVARLGSPEAVARRRAQVQQAGTAAGVRFAFERIEVLPNTAAAHAWVTRATASGTEAQQARLIELIFTAYFMEGQNIGDPSVLERLALECGLAAEGPRAHRGERHAHARALYPISGVPHFVFDGSLALSGAATPDALLNVMMRALRA
jgi:predicted DsbA family dithiol-disulfide isomerase